MGEDHRGKGTSCPDCDAIEQSCPSRLDWRANMFSFPNGSVFYRHLDRAYLKVVRCEGIYRYDRIVEEVQIDALTSALVETLLEVKP